MSALAKVVEMAMRGPTSRIEFLLLVDDLCQTFEGSITGGARTEKRNRDVGGHPNSRHLWRRNGAAIDVMFDTQTGYKRAVSTAKKRGLKVKEYSNELRLHLASIGDWVPG